MKEIIANINWTEFFAALWTIVLLPSFTLIANKVRNDLKINSYNKYTNILYDTVENVVKDIQETVVKDIKYTDVWDEDMKEEVKEYAKTKIVQSLGDGVYKALTEANKDFSEYLDSLIGTALYEIKNKE